MGNQSDDKRGNTIDEHWMYTHSVEELRRRGRREEAGHAITYVTMSAEEATTNVKDKSNDQG